MPESYDVVVKRSAAKELRAIPPPHSGRILKAIKRLASEPRPPGCEKLSRRHCYRIRVGAYRIVYTMQDDVLVIEIIKVAHRREAYR
ncbi:MAG: type II toxin-antitoxin system RelE/ParE family toxin [Deltaproteobacteria bacterium]|nr:type II toxin-antitoxin system RelE/ParE family toxin [Deltaproteobacteria bacterium]